jgi:hypothetical protein
VWAIDRLGHSLTDLLDTIQHLEACGVDLYLDQQAIDTTAPMGKLVVQLTGNPAGGLRGSRNKLSEEVICALLRDFREHGQKAIAKVRRTQPAAYLKILALLVPREHQVEHGNPLKKLTQEINIALTDPKIKQRIAELADTPLSLSVAGFTKLISDETEKWGSVIRAAGIKPD